MSVFKLPDLGEGLQEAEISEWCVAVGNRVELDQPLVAVETAKAVVEIPSPQAGEITRLWGEPGDILQVGDPLVEFANGASDSADAGTVVGRMESTGEVSEERASAVGHTARAGIKATPAVRALARRRNVDLSVVTPSGPHDTIIASDVERVARIFSEAGPLEVLRGVRRVMARSMAQAHAEVCAVTVCDDADIDAWHENDDIMMRLIRSISVACKAEPALNAWYDGHAVGRRVLKKIDLGIAIDTEDGLFVPVLRDVANRDREDLRRGLDAMRAGVRDRTMPPEELRGNSFTLSNFGTFGGRYADPVVLPPTVAILGAGKIRDSVVAAAGQPAVHRTLPLSLSFDHRAVTGGEATRFLAAAIGDLENGN